MVKSLLAIILLGVAAYFFSDLEADSKVVSVLLPLVVFGSLVSLCVWFVVLFHRRGIKQTGLSGSDGVSGGGFDGDIGGGC